MSAIFKKEIQLFLSSLIGYVVIGLFLILTGMFIWVFGETSILNYNFATLEQLFTIGPLVFLFLIPAITMRSFAEEYQEGTLELLLTKPISVSGLVTGKFLANVILVFLAIAPTFIYVYSLYQLGSPPGNLDMGAIIGSYLGLFLCGCAFVAIGMMASAMANNQIVGFLLAAFMCFVMYLGFDYVSSMPVFAGGADLMLQRLGLNDHYLSISKGAIQLRDVVYFLSVIIIFLILTGMVVEAKRK